jgi:hypothetical protein
MKAEHWDKGMMGKEISIHRDINSGREGHSCESRNPEKYWIPGQARNDNAHRTYIVTYDLYSHLNPISHYSNIPLFRRSLLEE